MRMIRLLRVAVEGGGEEVRWEGGGEEEGKKTKRWQA